MSFVVSVDIGGTFTDLFAVDTANAALYSAKSLTTVDDLWRGVFDCIDKAGLSCEAISTLVHGATVAINIAIERKGARTALVVTRGMRDVYEIARGNRPMAYSISFKRADPYVARRNIFEAEERYAASGEVLCELTREHAAAVAELVNAADVDAVAVCFLHSYAKPDHEILMGEALRRRMPNAHISLSHEIVREYREYERTSTTVLNAYVGPRSREYIGQLEKGLESRGFGGRFLIMQSNGGVMSPPTAKQMPVAMMESGPVGGVIASARVGREMGYENLITFDMGGTTAKMSLIQQGVPTIAPGYHIGGYATGHPITLPVVDIVEIGAGGGSVAWLDNVGALHVGPHSAGSQPGPICYGLGGSQPTVTDANLVLGRLSASNFLGGEMALDVAAARAGMERELGRLGLKIVEVASGIVKVAVSHMMLAMRAMSVERGYDPRSFAIVAQGGNGPLHALEIARELGVPQVIIPPLPGVFSAVGMLLADLRHDYVRTHHSKLEETHWSDIAAIFGELVASGREALLADGMQPENCEFERSLDLRYVGQEFALRVLVSEEQIRRGDAAAIRIAYDRAHEQRFGHAGPTEQVEIVNLRLVALGIWPKKPTLRQRTGASNNAAPGTRKVWLSDPDPVDCRVYDREALASDAKIEGPALIEERNSTTLLWPGDQARLADNGALIVEVKTR